MVLATDYKISFLKIDPDCMSEELPEFDAATLITRTIEPRLKLMGFFDSFVGFETEDN